MSASTAVRQERSVLHCILRAIDAGVAVMQQEIAAPSVFKKKFIVLGIHAEEKQVAKSCTATRTKTGLSKELMISLLRYDPDFLLKPVAMIALSENIFGQCGK